MTLKPEQPTKDVATELRRRTLQLGYFSQIICFCASVWDVDNKVGRKTPSFSFPHSGWQTMSQTGHLLVSKSLPAFCFLYIFFIRRLHLKYSSNWIVPFGTAAIVFWLYLRIPCRSHYNATPNWIAFNWRFHSGNGPHFQVVVKWNHSDVYLIFPAVSNFHLSFLCYFLLFVLCHFWQLLHGWETLRSVKRNCCSCQDTFLAFFCFDASVCLPQNSIS